MKKYFIVYISILFSLVSNGQEIKSYIINVEDGKVYLDITSTKAKVGDVFSIHEEAGYMLHPVTKKKIKKEGTIFADLEIVEVHKEYSVATIFPEDAVKKIKIGMIAEMPELPQGYVNTSSSNSSEILDNMETEEPQIVSVNAESIVRRYLRVTGLEKYQTGNVPPFWKKEQISYITKKGKEKVCNVYFAMDLSLKKLFFRHDSFKDNSFSALNVAFAINRNEGWVCFKKFKPSKIRDKYFTDLWDKQSDALGLQMFDESKWNISLSKRRTIRGKNCTGILFVSKNKDVVCTSYFDDTTGLIAYSEVNAGKDGTIQEDYLEYQKFGELLLCSKSVTTYTESKIKKKTTVLQDICFDCLLNNSLFTKEGVKQAFKMDL